MDLAVMPDPVATTLYGVGIITSKHGAGTCMVLQFIGSLQELFIAPKVKTAVPSHESFIHHTLQLLSRLSQTSYMRQDSH